MPLEDLAVEVCRTVEAFLTSVDELAPGLVTGFYLVGSVAPGDFHPDGAGARSAQHRERYRLRRRDRPAPGQRICGGRGAGRGTRSHRRPLS